MQSHSNSPSSTFCKELVHASFPGRPTHLHASKLKGAWKEQTSKVLGNFSPFLLLPLPLREGGLRLAFLREDMMCNKEARIATVTMRRTTNCELSRQVAAEMSEQHHSTHNCLKEIVCPLPLDKKCDHMSLCLQRSKTCIHNTTNTHGHQNNGEIQARVDKKCLQDLWQIHQQEICQHDRSTAKQHKLFRNKQHLFHCFSCFECNIRQNKINDETT